ncbi:MAG: hypothetical protein PHW62_00505 [Candidatus Ratteibacteria bacterium]|nr:hypothetical protein [Candidatus Ratteibacteria bacterium]
MNLKSVLGLLMCLPIIFWIIAIAYAGAMFDINIGGHMKRAADANTIELATEEMRTVVQQMESSGLTTGYTSILYRTPDEDIRFWYNNMHSSLAELESTPQNATSLEKSNILMKLRETLLDNGNGRNSITAPPGISRYPDNKFYATAGAASLLFIIIGVCIYSQSKDEEEYILRKSHYKSKK